MTDMRSADAIQDDVAALLRTLGLSDHARPVSPHEAVQGEILPAIAALVRDLDIFRRENLRLLQAQREWWKEKKALIADHGALGVRYTAQVATLQAVVMQRSCSQCGEPYRTRACGPTHASIAAALAEGA